MRRTLQVVGSLAAMALAGCSGSGRDSGDASTSGGTRTETGAVQGADTSMGMSGMATDSSRTGMSDTAMSGSGMSDTGSAMTKDTGGMSTSRSSDSAKSNQTKSGVTNTKTGKSTLGPGVTKTRPDQGAPVTSKGDTIGRSGDSMSKAPR